MPDIQASIEFLAKIPLYETEKPYLVLLTPQEGLDVDALKLDNLSWETHDDIHLADIRGHEDEYTLGSCGFQVVRHASKCLDLADASGITAYKHETEGLLKDVLGGCHAVCYEARLRKNVKTERSVLDLNDPLLVEGPARGAHVDATFTSGPQIIERYLSPEDKARYFRPGFRFRIVNTWRPLLPIIEDRPLALSHYHHIDPTDLVEADRVLPNRVGEVYYLQHNPAQQWYWLEHQTPEEPFLMLMYDTKAELGPRYCPHVSFENARAPQGCPPRHSIETRSIVISEV